MIDLSTHIRGTVLDPEPYSRDYGNTRRVAPRAVVKAVAVEDVQAVVVEARRRGLRVVPRGHACSSDGQTLTEHIVLDTTGLDALEIGEDQVVTVGAGIRWGALQEALWARGRANLVLVDNAASTVGGTLSVGGIGSTTIARGAQVDQVVSLDVVTGEGELVTAARGGPHADLFEYTLCGLGQTGIITRARLRTRPRPRSTWLLRKHLPATASLEDVAGDVLSSGPWDHCFFSFVLARSAWQVVVGRDIDGSTEPPEPGPGQLVLEEYHRQRFATAAAYLPAMAKAQVDAGLLLSPEAACNVWSDFFLPTDAAGALGELIRPLLEDARLTQGPLGLVLRQPGDRPRLPLSPIPGAPEVVSMGVYCVLPPELVAEYQRRFHRASEACTGAGGRVYLYGCHPRTEGFYRAQFGEQTMAAWRAVKDRYDPGDILGSPLFS